MIKIKSNAKINLGLRIVSLGSEYSKYHLLNSVFIPIDLYDELEFNDSDIDCITGSDIPLKNNLIYETICLVREKYHVDKNVKVKITKNIPVMAGLGGGSSNAAFTLIALNQLWKLNLSHDELLKLACKIGSDVPFFLKNTTSYVRGRGEIVTPIKIDPVKGVLIFNNAFFSTKEIFNEFDKLGLELSSDEPQFTEIQPINDLQKAITNMRDYHKVMEPLEDLKNEGASIYLMSGSGGSVFGLFDDDIKRAIAFSNLKKKYKHIWNFSSI